MKIYLIKIFEFFKEKKDRSFINITTLISVFSLVISFISFLNQFSGNIIIYYEWNIIEDIEDDQDKQYKIKVNWIIYNPGPGSSKIKKFYFKNSDTDCYKRYLGKYDFEIATNIKHIIYEYINGQTKNQETKKEFIDSIKNTKKTDDKEAIKIKLKEERVEKIEEEIKQDIEISYNTIYVDDSFISPDYILESGQEFSLLNMTFKVKNTNLFLEKILYDNQSNIHFLIEYEKIPFLPFSLLKNHKAKSLYSKETNEKCSHNKI